MRVNRPGALAAVGLLALAACSLPQGASPLSCTSDHQCRMGQLCFAEGCGDPGDGIVVEVAGDALSGQYPQDFPVADGTLGALRDFDLGEPLGLRGVFRRELAAVADPATQVDYAAPVVLKAVGQSEYIPRTSRLYEQRIDAPVDGSWGMHLGAGRYALTAFPVDSSIPPASATDLAVRPDGGAPAITFVFPALAGTVSVSGRLIDATDATVLPTQELAITQGAMDLQAFDPRTLLPLSQRFPVSSGQPGSNGNFAMTLRPEARSLARVLFRATPRDSAAPLPSKEFLVDTPLPDPVRFELGAPGSPLTLGGQALGPDGQPVDRAQVIVSGVVRGGGNFRSRVAVTDARGAFLLLTLPGRDQLSITVVPPPESAAAVTTVRLAVTAASPMVTVRCGQRVQVSGSVLTPAGLPGAGVDVRASEHLDPGSDPRPLPLESTTERTDLSGAFSLRLDPGVWRLEFTAAGLPLTSRLVTVSGELDAFGNPILDQPLAEPIRLSAGRSIAGTVTGTRAGRTGVPIPWSTVRFFRVGPIGGVSTAILLGAAVSDDRGRYRLVLPGTY